MKTYHQSYLLRLVPTQRDGLRRYRATLRNAQTREWQHFADIESLIVHLQEMEARLVDGRIETAVSASDIVAHDKDD